MGRKGDDPCVFFVGDNGGHVFFVNTEDGSNVWGERRWGAEIKLP